MNKRNSLLFSMLAMGMCMNLNSPFNIRKESNNEKSVDFFKNINPYISKPLRKGVFEKKLSRKKRKDLNNKRRK